MNPCSAPVLGCAALVASSALWQAAEGTLTLEVALTRYLVAVAIAWAALSAVAMLVGSPMRTPAPSDAPEEGGGSETPGTA